MMITEEQQLVSAKRGNYTIKTYDDGNGPLWIMCDSMGVMGIVRARTWEDAYEIAEDELFPDADETMEEIIKEYGFKREHKKVIKGQRGSDALSLQYLGEGEKWCEYPGDYSDNGKLPEGAFIRYQTVETPDPEAWADNELFQEAYGFRPNGGIYAKDLNGERLEPLTDKLCQSLDITLELSAQD